MKAKKSHHMEFIKYSEDINVYGCGVKAIFKLIWET